MQTFSKLNVSKITWVYYFNNFDVIHECFFCCNLIQGMRLLYGTTTQVCHRLALCFCQCQTPGFLEAKNRERKGYKSFQCLKLRAVKMRTISWLFRTNNFRLQKQIMSGRGGTGKGQS